MNGKPRKKSAKNKCLGIFTNILANKINNPKVQLKIHRVVSPVNAKTNIPNATPKNMVIRILDLDWVNNNSMTYL